MLSGNPRQADPPRAIRDCPQARIDAPIRSTPVQSPMFYQDPSTGYLVPVFSNVASLPYANAISDSRTAGFNAEARGTSMQGTEIASVSVCYRFFQSTANAIDVERGCWQEGETRDAARQTAAFRRPR